MTGQILNTLNKAPRTSRSGSGVRGAGLSPFSPPRAVLRRGSSPRAPEATWRLRRCCDDGGWQQADGDRREGGGGHLVCPEGSQGWRETWRIPGDRCYTDVGYTVSTIIMHGSGKAQYV